MTTPLRKTSDEDDTIPYRESGTTLVLIPKAGEQVQSHTIGGKTDILRLATPEDLLLLAWTGRYRTDLFVVDNPAALCAVFRVEPEAWKRAPGRPPA